MKMETDKIMDESSNNSTPQANVDLFHSPKGNNQFNHYPMKIPPSAVCDFTHDTWPDYVGFFQDNVEDMVRVDECPVAARTMRFGNLVADKKMLVEYAPSGLWMLYLHVYNDAGEGFSVTVTLKLLQDGYF